MPTAGIRFRVKRPKTLSRASMDAAIRKAAEKAAKDMANDMTIITKGWSGGPLKFVGKVQGGRRSAWLIFARPENPGSKGAEIWTYLDEGTKGPYLIPKQPKQDGWLVFQAGYKAGSKPNRVTTVTSKRFGPIRRKKQVEHPGIKARNWTKLRYKKWQKKLPKYLSDAMGEAAKVSQHPYK